jgi:hypothetical protein
MFSGLQGVAAEAAESLLRFRPGQALPGSIQMRHRVRGGEALKGFGQVEFHS